MGDDATRVEVDGHLDWGRVVDNLNRLLRLRTTPIGMKRFETVAEMEAVPRLRRPTAIHTMDQIVGQAARFSRIRGAIDTLSDDDRPSSRVGTRS